MSPTGTSSDGLILTPLRSTPNRQNAYGQRFQLDGVYTPQMVINGAEQIVGSDRAALAQAVQKEEEQRPRMLSPHSVP